MSSFLGGADPQKQYADAVIEVLPTQLIPDDNEGKVLRVRLIMKEGVTYFSPVYLFDEGSTISWIPCGRKLTCSYPGINFSYGPDTYYGHEVLHPPISIIYNKKKKKNIRILISSVPTRFLFWRWMDNLTD